MTTPNALRAMDRLIKVHNMSPAQAAAMVGGFQVESYPELRTGAVGDKGTSFGIYQARGPRAAYMRGYKSPHNPADELDRQVDAAANELKTTEKYAAGLLSKAGDVRSAARAAIGFERPQNYSRANPEAGLHFGKRLSNAESLLRAYDPNTPLPPSRPSDLQFANQTPGTPPQASSSEAISAALNPVQTNPLDSYINQRQQNQQAAVKSMEAAAEAAQAKPPQITPTAPMAPPIQSMMPPPMGPMGPIMPMPQGAGLGPLARRKRGLLDSEPGYAV